MINDRKPLTWIYGWTKVLVLKYFKGPRWIPQSPIQHTRCTFLLGIVSGIPIADGNVSAPVPKLIIESWFREVVIWLSWIRRWSKWVDTIEPWEWVETMMASASWRSDIHPSFAMRLLYNLSKENVILLLRRWARSIPFYSFVDCTISFQRNFGYLLQLNAMFILEMV